MFETIKDNFYHSLSKSIENRKNAFDLNRDQILTDERRVSKIVNTHCNRHYPHLICKGEYPRLSLLFSCKSSEEYTDKNDLYAKPEELIKKYGNNYDEMLWGHIDWDKMFQDVIAELDILDKLDMPQESNISEESQILRDLEKRFKYTLIDYVPYAIIRYDELPYEYPKIYIFPDKRKEIKQKAIQRVHLDQGSELFKQTFLDRFRGKTLREFDKEFLSFVSDYLNKRAPSDCSFGLQAYNFHKNLSKFVIDWQSLSSVRYGDMLKEESSIQIQLKKYIEYSRAHMKKLEKFQQKFDTIY